MVYEKQSSSRKLFQYYGILECKQYIVNSERNQFDAFKENKTHGCNVNQ